MKTTGAVLWEQGGKWEVEEVELDPPGPGEVLVGARRERALPLRRAPRHRGPAGRLPRGTFARHTVVPVESVVKIDEGFPLHLAALVGCGVTTGFGSAVRTAELRAGDTAVVIGVGGVGANAVQGAHIANCRYVVAVDPVEFEREKALELGATHVAESTDAAWEIVSALTRGRLAEAAILTTGVAEGSAVQSALQLVGKRGHLVVTALGRAEESTATLSLLELITRGYTLDQVNEGYEDMRAGRNIRGLIRY